MLRLMLNDELWFKLREIMLQHGIYDKPNLRMIVEAMLYRMRVGCPWRDLPTDFGCWNSIYQQFNRGKCMIVKLHQNLSKSYLLQSTQLRIKAMIAKRFEISSEKNHPSLLSQERAILRLVIRIWIGVFINTDIWLKIYLPE